MIGQTQLDGLIRHGQLERFFGTERRTIVERDVELIAALEWLVAIVDTDALMRCGIQTGREHQAAREHELPWTKWMTCTHLYHRLSRHETKCGGFRLPHRVRQPVLAAERHWRLQPAAPVRAYARGPNVAVRVTRDEVRVQHLQCSPHLERLGISGRHEDIHAQRRAGPIRQDADEPSLGEFVPDFRLRLKREPCPGEGQLSDQRLIVADDTRLCGHT